MSAISSLLALVPLLLVLAWALGRSANQEAAPQPVSTGGDPSSPAPSTGGSPWPDAAALRFMRPFALLGGLGLLTLGVSAPFFAAYGAAILNDRTAGFPSPTAVLGIASSLFLIAVFVLSGPLVLRFAGLYAGGGVAAWPRRLRFQSAMALSTLLSAAAVALLLNFEWLEPTGSAWLDYHLSGTDRWPDYLAGSLALLATLWSAARGREPAERVAALCTASPPPGWLVWTLRAALAGGIAAGLSPLLASSTSCGLVEASVGQLMPNVMGCSGLAYHGVLLAVLLNQRPRFRRMASPFAPKEGWSKEHRLMGWLLALAWVQAWAGVLTAGIVVATMVLRVSMSGFGSGALRNAPAIGLVLLLVWLFTWRAPSRPSDAASEEEEAADYPDEAPEPGGETSTALGPQ